MGAVQIKEELYKFIEGADSRLLKVLYAVAKEYNQDDYIVSGEPMSKEVLKGRINAAKSRIKSGQFTTQKQLEKEMNEW